jgi:hypothetical protein
MEKMMNQTMKKKNLKLKVINFITNIDIYASFTQPYYQLSPPVFVGIQLIYTASEPGYPKKYGRGLNMDLKIPNVA